MDRGIQCSNEIKNATYNLNNLKKDIYPDLAEYLNIEYGAPDYSEPISPSEIVYVGEYSACEQRIKIWKYPCSSNNCFVGILPWKNAYLTTMVSPEFEI